MAVTKASLRSPIFKCEIGAPTIITIKVTAAITVRNRYESISDGTTNSTEAIISIKETTRKYFNEAKRPSSGFSLPKR